MSSSLYDPTMEEYLAAIEEAIPRYLPASDFELKESVFRAMSYACESGGKRLRPVLVLEFCRLCGGNTKKALPFACAIEMIHSYSLVHDDLPCMDNSLLRRGRPSAFAAFGEDMALLAGDALLNRAFEVMLDPANQQGLDPQAVLKAAFSLANASGAYGMVGGQVLDLLSERQEIDLITLEELQRGKTGAIIIAACEMGCYLAGANGKQIEAAHRYGEQLGLCFQIVDDILDATSTTEQLGKPTGSDEKNGKVTYVSLLGLEAAYQLAEKRTQDAIEALSCFDQETDGLRDLARALLQRKK